MIDALLVFLQQTWVDVQLNQFSSQVSLFFSAPLCPCLKSFSRRKWSHTSPQEKKGKTLTKNEEISVGKAHTNTRIPSSPPLSCLTTPLVALFKNSHMVPILLWVHIHTGHFPLSLLAKILKALLPSSNLNISDLITLTVNSINYLHCAAFSTNILGPKYSPHYPVFKYI